MAPRPPIAPRIEYRARQAYLLLHVLAAIRAVAYYRRHPRG